MITLSAEFQLEVKIFDFEPYFKSEGKIFISEFQLGTLTLSW